MVQIEENTTSQMRTHNTGYLKNQVSCESLIIPLLTQYDIQLCYSFAKRHNALYPWLRTSPNPRILSENHGMFPFIDKHFGNKF